MIRKAGSYYFSPSCKPRLGVSPLLLFITRPLKWKRIGEVRVVSLLATFATVLIQNQPNLDSLSLRQMESPGLCCMHGSECVQGGTKSQERPNKGWGSDTISGSCCTATASARLLSSRLGTCPSALSSSESFSSCEQGPVLSTHPAGRALTRAMCHGPSALSFRLSPEVCPCRGLSLTVPQLPSWEHPTHSHMPPVCLSPPLDLDAMG